MIWPKSAILSQWASLSSMQQAQLHFLIGKINPDHSTWMRMPGVEPGSQAWGACMMPLHYVRSWCRAHVEVALVPPCFPRSLTGKSCEAPDCDHYQCMGGCRAALSALGVNAGWFVLLLRILLLLLLLLRLSIASPSARLACPTNGRGRATRLSQNVFLIHLG